MTRLALLEGTERHPLFHLLKERKKEISEVIAIGPAVLGWALENMTKGDRAWIVDIILLGMDKGNPLHPEFDPLEIIDTLKRHEPTSNIPIIGLTSIDWAKEDRSPVRPDHVEVVLYQGQTRIVESILLQLRLLQRNNRL